MSARPDDKKVAAADRIFTYCFFYIFTAFYRLMRPVRPQTDDKRVADALGRLDGARHARTGAYVVGGGLTLWHC
jgi:hypothetical protein